MTVPIAMILVGLVLSPGSSWSQQPVPEGDQFQVNTYIQGGQGQPSVAIDPLGNFVVVWQSGGSFEDDNSTSSIQAQRYDAFGAPVGDQFQVNSYTTSSQDRAAVALDGAGNFVVVWESLGSDSTDTSEESIRARRFDSAGSPIGADFEVNTYTTDEQREPAVAMDAAGNFVVVWESEGSFDTDNHDGSVQAQMFASNGDPLGGEFQVNTSTYQRQDDAAVTADGLGNFIVVWDSAFVRVNGQRYDANGAPLGGEFEVDTRGYGNDPAVAANGAGNFTVAWTAAEGGGVDDSDSSVEAQRFDTNGDPVGDQFQVNTYTTDWQERPSIAVDSLGNIIIAWESDGSSGTDSSLNSLQAQYFDTNGIRVGGEFQVNTYTINDQRRPSVAMDGLGSFVVVWGSGRATGDPLFGSVHGRRYSSGLAVLYLDGFESGDFGDWSSTAP